MTFGAGRGSDTKGAGSPDIPRPTYDPHRRARGNDEAIGRDARGCRRPLGRLTALGLPAATQVRPLAYQVASDPRTRQAEQPRGARAEQRAHSGIAATSNSALRTFGSTTPFKALSAFVGSGIPCHLAERLLPAESGTAGAR